MRVGVLLALLLMIAHEAVSQQLPIIDMHMHAGAPYVSNGEAAPCFPIGFCTPLPGGAKTDNELLQSTLDEEGAADEKLSAISLMLNAEAMKSDERGMSARDYRSESGHYPAS